MISRQHILQILCVLAFVLAQVSPACAFVSGKMSLLEICAADGSLKTIKVSGNFNPLEKSTPKQNDKMAKDCAFCFSQAHMGKVPVYSSTVIEPQISSAYRITSAGTIVPVGLKYSSSLPRAPPYLF